MNNQKSQVQRYVADAPEQHVRAAVPLVLAESGVYRLTRATRQKGVAWEIRLQEQPDQPLAYVHVTSAGGKASSVTLEFTPQAPADAVATLTERLVEGLQRYGFHLETGDEQAVPSASPVPVVPEALFIGAPGDQTASLVDALQSVLAQYGCAVRPLILDVPDTARLAAAVRRARLVVADVSTPAGVRGAVEASRRNVPLIPLAPADADLPRAFADRTVRYGLAPETFAQELHAAVVHLLGRPKSTSPEPPASQQEPVTPVASQSSNRETGAPSPGLRLPPVQVETAGKRPAEALLEMRRQIYRRIALDPEASPLNRLHAARVLAASSDLEHAARALGDLTHVADPAEVAHLAMEALVSLGEAALPVLWELDAGERDPARLLEIARRLFQAGDPDTARLRLEELVVYGPRRVQQEAFRALVELELTDPAQLQTLAEEVQEAELKLQAALGLGKLPKTRHIAVNVLEEIALTASPGVAERAVQGLAAIRRKAALKALQVVAAQASHPAVRLAAARALLERGEAEAAREAFHQLALHSTDEKVALTALQHWSTFEGVTPQDLERVMRQARLFAVRRTVAIRLAEDVALPERVRQQALAVLLEGGEHERVIPLLERFVWKAREEPLRRWAVRALLKLGAQAESRLVNLLYNADRATAMSVATAALQDRASPALVRRVGVWLMAQGQVNLGASALAELACQAETPPGEALAATTALVQELERARTKGQKQTLVARLARVAQESPHTDARQVARQALLRHAPAALPVSLLVDALTLSAHVPAGLQPALRELERAAPAAAQHMVERLVAPDTGRELRWRLLNLLVQFPPDVATAALNQVLSRSQDDEVIYAAADRLLALGQSQTALAALAALAERAPDTRIRHQAVYRLASRGSLAARLLAAVAAHSPYPDTRALARRFLAEQPPQTLLERVWMTAERLVERMGLVEE